MRQAFDAIVNVLAGGDFDNPLCDLKQAALALQQAIAEAEKREWVGLTDEEKGWCAAPTYEETIERVEAKLKEKNA
jgi:hypothetical protein